MKNKGLIVLFFLLMFFPSAAMVAAAGIDSSYKYAWGERIGWINFGAATGTNAVTVGDTAVTGYIWSEQFGWIHLNPSAAGVTNTFSGDLGGFAWGEQIGYVDFNNVSINSSGEFIGFATTSEMGTISFNCANTSSCIVSDFKVKTSWRPSVASSSSSGSSPATGQFSSIGKTGDAMIFYEISRQIKEAGEMVVDLFKRFQNRTGFASRKNFFYRPLFAGIRGRDVVVLQEILLKRGLLLRQPTGFFDKDTLRAVGELQISAGLVNGKDSPVYGYVGPRTRQFLNGLIAGKNF